MSRINQKAFNILAKEIAIAAAKDDVAGEVAKDIALRRLNRLRSQKGKPPTEAEIRELFQDILPNFSQEEIKSNAISQWQMEIDELSSIPTATLGGKMAQTKLKAYNRDFKEVSGFIAGNVRTNGT